MPIRGYGRAVRHELGEHRHHEAPVPGGTAGGDPDEGLSGRGVTSAVLVGAVILVVCANLTWALGDPNCIMPPFAWRKICLTAGFILSGAAAAAMLPLGSRWSGVVAVCALGGLVATFGVCMGVLWVLGGGPETSSHSGAGAFVGAAGQGALWGAAVAYVGQAARGRPWRAAALVLPVVLIVVGLCCALAWGRANTARQGREAARLIDQFLPTLLVDPSPVELDEVSWWDLSFPRLSVHGQIAQPPGTVNWSLDRARVSSDMLEVAGGRCVGLLVTLPSTLRGWDALSAISLTAAGVRPDLFGLLHGPDPRIHNPGKYLECELAGGGTVRIEAPSMDRDGIRITCGLGSLH